MEELVLQLSKAVDEIKAEYDYLKISWIDEAGDKMIRRLSTATEELLEETEAVRQCYKKLKTKFDRIEENIEETRESFMLSDEALY